MIASIIQVLVQDVGVQAVVPQNRKLDTVKVYPVMAPQGEQSPFVTVRLAARNPRPNGKNCDPTHDEITIRITSVSSVYETVESIDQAIFDVLEGSSGNLSGVNYTRININNSVDEFARDRDEYLRVSDYLATIKR